MFDLDGTLSDPKVGITKSVQYALNKIGVLENDLDRLECFIGPPLQESFGEYYGFDLQKSNQAIEYYRERFKEKGMFENVLYSHIPELLMELKDRGYVLVVATSKPTVFAEKILKHFKIDAFFDLVVGSNLDGTRVAKTEVIQYILEQYTTYELSDFIMIGDRKHDIIGAKNTSIDCIGVTYGYGSNEEIRLAAPTYTATSVKELKDILLDNIMKVKN